MLRRLLLDQQQWVYVPSAPHDAELLTLGQALHAGEYAIVERADAKLRALLHSGSAEVRRRQDLVRFLSDAGKAIVRGVYRSSELAPPVLFYAHKDYTHAAALVALSDSTLQEHRGFPLLIDLADRICAGAFARHALVSQIDALIASTSSSPFQWLGERHTRPWGR